MLVEITSPSQNIVNNQDVYNHLGNDEGVGSLEVRCEKMVKNGMRAVPRFLQPQQTSRMNHHPVLHDLNTA